MKNWLKAILGTVMAVVCMMTMSLSAFAADDLGITIPVTISLSGTLPETAEDFTVKLTADDASYPMPEGADGNEYTMKITGADTKNFPVITYDELGVYTYTISQAAGENKKCTYDKMVYSLTVYVTNKEDGSGLEASAVLYPDTKGDKQACAEFKNQYEIVTPTPTATSTPTPTPTKTPSPKTGDNSAVAYYAVIIGVCAGVIAIALAARRKRNNKD